MPDIEGLQSDLRSAIEAAAADLQRQGIDLSRQITSGYRTREEQARLYAGRASNPNPVAEPGHSPHERGAAVDISLRGLPEYQQEAVIEALGRHGLERPVASDPVHWQLNQEFARTEATAGVIGGIVGMVGAASVLQALGTVVGAIREELRPGLDGTMQPVLSSMIAAAGYDRMANELIVEYVHGRVYRYAGVPVEIFDGLMTAGSKGTFMRANVIGQYPF